MKNWLVVMVFVALPANAADGLVALKSPHAAKATMDRLEAALKEKGLTIFARIDLPLKALVWQDESGQVWLGYNDPAYLAARHGVAQCPAAAGLKKALAGFAQQAVSK